MVSAALLAPLRPLAPCRTASAYEATIRATGLGVEASLRAFDRAPAENDDGRRPWWWGRDLSPTVVRRASRVGPIGRPGFDALVEQARKLRARHGMVVAVRTLPASSTFKMMPTTGASTSIGSRPFAEIELRSATASTAFR